MFIAFEYMDFYKEGKFQISKKRKDCPPWQHIVRVSAPCFVEVNFGYHPIVGLYSHKVRTFKEKTGLTPSKYVRTIKMEKAKRLVEETDLSVLEIMSKVGFDDASHFSKLFKSHYGTSPQKWRKQTSNAIKHFYKNT